MSDSMGDGTMPGPEHFREPIENPVSAVEKAIRAGERFAAALNDSRAEDIDGRSNRPGLGATLLRTVDLLLDVARTHYAGRGTVDLDSFLESSDAERVGIELLKSIMLAGWIAPDERTVGIPNALVLHEEQWRELAAGSPTWIITPGGEQALELIAHSSESPPSAHVRESLWKLREDSSDPTRGGSTWDKHGSRDVTVPRSFLSFVVMLAAEFRRAGDYAAANSLDNALAGIAAELRAARIDWHDGEGATPASAPPTQSNDELTRLHHDIIKVLRYVSMGLSRARSAPNLYPDFFARRALGTIELKDVPVGTDTHDHPMPWWSPLRASAGTTPEPVGMKPVRDMTIGEVQELIKDYEARHPEFTRVGTGESASVTRQTDCSRVKDELLKIVSEHPLTRDEFTDTNSDDVWVGYVAQQAGRLLRWYDSELTRITSEGSPGVMHGLDLAFHKLAIMQRDFAWTESANRKQRIEELEAELEQLRAQLELNQPKYSALTWAKMEGIRLTNYHGWDREQRDIKTPITRTQFLELAELCAYVVLEGLEPDEKPDGDV